MFDVVIEGPQLLDISAFFIAFPLASLGAPRVEESGQPWLLLSLYLGLGLAIAFLIRFGSRVAADAQRRELKRGGATLGSVLPPLLGLARAPARTPAPRVERAPTAVDRPVAPAPRAPPPRPEDIVGRLRARMDEISYEPGAPNVLSMVKYGGPDLEAVAGAGSAICQREDLEDVTVVRIGGMLEVLAVPQVRAVTDAILAEQRLPVTVDLTGLTRIDSTGVELVVGMYTRAAAAGRTVRVSGLSGQPLAVFRLMRLDRVFDLG
jgi:anti-sigma B factor antagonist